ncbi:hypothetical protein D9M71_592420 [compost metagenome]
MKFRRAKSKIVFQRRHHGHLAVFHAGRDLGKQHIAFEKAGIAFLDLNEGPVSADIDLTGFGFHGRHGDKGNREVIVNLRLVQGWVDGCYFRKPDPHPVGRQTAAFLALDVLYYFTHHATNAPLISSRTAS